MTDYFTEHDDVMQNKLGIDDPAVLKQAEADIVSVRLAELLQKPMKGAFDFARLRAIHKHLFSDLYIMAGKVRDVDIAKGHVLFCLVENISACQTQIFKKLKEEKYLCGLDRVSFSYKLAELSGELNALHPFRDGNGRTIRCFLIQLANHAGYEIRFEDVDKEELLKADIAAFSGDIECLAKVYERIISPLE